MTVTLAMALAARVLGALFFLLLIVGGLRAVRHRFHPSAMRRRQIVARVSQRYALGEIDAETLRQYRADFKDWA